MWIKTCKIDFRKDAVYMCFANSISMTLHKAFEVIQSNVRRQAS